MGSQIPTVPSYLTTFTPQHHLQTPDQTPTHPFFAKDYIHFLTLDCPSLTPPLPIRPPSHHLPPTMSGLKVLCVAEKPSVARALCDILRQRPNSSSQSLSSRSHINSITQITVPFLPNIHSNGPVHVIVTSVLGHVYRKDFPSDYNNWNNIDPETLFSAPIVSLTPPNSEGLLKI